MSAIINARVQQIVNVARSVSGCVANAMARIDVHLRPDACHGHVCLGHPRERGGWKYSSWQAGKTRSTTSLDTMRRRFTALLAWGRPAIPVPVRLSV